MNRDEQSAWQAGKYSFLTPTSTEWCNRTTTPVPFSSPYAVLIPPSFPNLTFFPLFFSYQISTYSDFTITIHRYPSYSQKIIFSETHFSTHLLSFVIYLPTSPRLPPPTPYTVYTGVALTPPNLSHPSGQLSLTPPSFYPHFTNGPPLRQMSLKCGCIMERGTKGTSAGGGSDTDGWQWSWKAFI